MGQLKNKKVIVFKYGGNAMTDDRLKEQVLQNICALTDQQHHIVIVHGGGPFIKKALEDARIESEFIDGHRKTTTEAFAYVEMALKGKVNGNLVSLINRMGYRAVGLSGKDGQTVTATKRIHTREVDGTTEEIDLGQVGDVASVDTTLIISLLEQNYIPVVTCLADDQSGNGFNINADMFAGHLAGALQADQFVVLTDVDGLLENKDDPDTLISELNLANTSKLLEKGVIAGGMIPKVASCEIAINKGVRSARIINGTKPEQILQLLENKPTGTEIHK
ncbi:MAG: acetylglutamate kinase [Bacteroidales bacterium]|nr:acetylglutamate kinase [Bacteroidales bacterium]